MGNEKIYFNAFALTGLFGPERFSRLFKKFSSLEKAWNANEKNFQNIFFEKENNKNRDNDILKKFSLKREKINPENEFEKLEAEKVKILTIKDKNYPKKLKQIPHPPALLYVKGEILPQDENAIAVVGTRRLSKYGETAAKKLAEDLAKAGLTIVSGLALGIDARAHEAALKAGGRTIGVIGSGLNKENFYPEENWKLAQNIFQNGAVISEYPLGERAWPQNFPLRNRIISGLSKGVIIVEAKEKSGALITAQIALEQNREVFAVPGSIFSQNSIGPNSLIKMGAKLTESANDVLEELGFEIPDKKSGNKILDDLEKKILELIEEPTHIDEIIKKSGLAANQIITSLTIMELKGAVKNIGGETYMVIYQ